jgi:NAD-dependent dihydropyrimidine dehydrogenase PreA subunit
MADPTQPTILVKEELCRKDGLCAKLCPVRIFAARVRRVYWSLGRIP